MPPLAGIEVLSLAEYGPGAMCGRILAELGASVTYLQRPDDDDRRADAATYEAGRAWVRFAGQRGTRQVFDLKDVADRERVWEFLDHTDVVLEGFRPGVADRLGVGYRQAARCNAKIIYCSLSGYGQEGPLAMRSGHDLNYAAMSGLLMLGHREGETPRNPRLTPGDFVSTPLAAVAAILAAMVQRDRFGTAQHIDLSMQEATFQCLARFVVPAAADPGSLADSRFLFGDAPWYSIYEAGDGAYLAVAAVERKFFQRLCNLVGHPEWIDAHGDQVERWDQVRAEMAALFGTRPREFWLELLADQDTCVSAVLTIEEALHEPQLRYRGAVRFADGGPVVGLGPVVPVAGSLPMALPPAENASEPPIA
jgi:crotonobetainyl-CoA:carnitine CoA-transferase CaiB-like acyl-CoA transferase